MGKCHVPTLLIHALHCLCKSVGHTAQIVYMYNVYITYYLPIDPICEMWFNKEIWVSIPFYSMFVIWDCCGISVPVSSIVQHKYGWWLFVASQASRCTQNDYHYDWYIQHQIIFAIYEKRQHRKMAISPAVLKWTNWLGFVTMGG